LGALSVTDVALFKDAYGALLKQNATVQARIGARRRRGKVRTIMLTLRGAIGVAFATASRQHCAFIVEPLVQGAAGMAMYHPVYLRRARELCDQYDVHLIADEIAVGMGRTGTMFACEQANIVPDFFCCQKAFPAVISRCRW